MEFKIEKGIPIPDNNNDVIFNSMPIEQMEVGDSIFIPRACGLTANAMAQMTSELRRRFPTMAFTTQKVKDRGRRLWRIR